MNWCLFFLQQSDIQHQKLNILQKDIAHQRRLLRSKLSGHHERAVRSQLAERRRGAAQMRRNYQDFHLAQSARLKRKKNKDELVLRKVFDRSLADYREQLQSMRQYSKEKQAIYRQEQIDRLTSMSRWYQDQLAELEAAFAKARHASADDDAAMMREVSKIRKAFRERLKARITEIQESFLDDDEASIMQRLRDVRLHVGP